ncbi:hypothetical protein GYMLUDRAFT_639550 [Collybiopsis luxurians FD-317 M1]|nr:hypothetical protein GYMLUDRAFT_639550 [Collybiopsis luxurians FD-317 M1]
MHPKTEDGPSPSCIHCVLHRIELDSLRLENEKLKESLVHLSTQKTEEANRNRQLQINLNDTRTELASTRGALVKIKVEMARIGIQSRVETENVKAVTIDDEDEISKIKTQGDSQSPIRPKRSRRASPDVESIRRSPKRTKLEEVNITAEPTNSTTNTILESGTEAKDVNYVAGSTVSSVNLSSYLLLKNTGAEFRTK